MWCVPQTDGLLCVFQVNQGVTLPQQSVLDPTQTSTHVSPASVVCAVYFHLIKQMFMTYVIAAICGH